MLIADPLQWDQVTSHQAVTWNSSAMKLNRAGFAGGSKP
jgi:tRNA U55 pseudouridine synthase TruB